ncbi:hypothetical protein [Modicisalibacter luteus]|uniref:hypothetical protein n=1 Tax=Modicisalibacter luteus TaxID=453962 RepID=UPI003635B406
MWLRPPLLRSYRIASTVSGKTSTLLPLRHTKRPALMPLKEELHLWLALKQRARYVTTMPARQMRLIKEARRFNVLAQT